MTRLVTPFRFARNSQEKTPVNCGLLNTSSGEADFWFTRAHLLPFTRHRRQHSSVVRAEHFILGTSCRQTNRNLEDNE